MGTLTAVVVATMNLPMLTLRSVDGPPGSAGVLNETIDVSANPSEGVGFENPAGETFDQETPKAGSE